jgi:hypothetical protein
MFAGFRARMRGRQGPRLFMENLAQGLDGGNDHGIA